MKIALYHNLTSGGSKREAYEFARQFVQNGHQLDVYYPETADESFLPLNTIAHHVYAFPLALNNQSILFPGITNYARLVRKIQNIKRVKDNSLKVAEAINSQNYDYVFVHHDRIVQSPYLLNFLQVPSIYYCAEPMREFYEPLILRPYQIRNSFIDRAQYLWYSPARFIEKVFIRSEDKKNVKKASLLMTNSFFSAESIYRAYGLRARVVYLGVDTEKFRPLPNEKENYVLSVGAVSPLKGYDFIIEALGTIEGQRPKLIIIGNTVSPSEKKILQISASRLNVQLEIYENVSEEKLVWFYNRARAFVYAPILEPFGLAPVEAMACGLPVIAVKEGGVRESVIDGVTGFLVERVPKLFGEAVMKVNPHQKSYEEISENCRKQVLAFWTWEHAYHRFENTVFKNP